MKKSILTLLLLALAFVGCREEKQPETVVKEKVVEKEVVVEKEEDKGLLEEAAAEVDKEIKKEVSEEIDKIGDDQ